MLSSGADGCLSRDLAGVLAWPGAPTAGMPAVRAGAGLRCTTASSGSGNLLRGGVGLIGGEALRREWLVEPLGKRLKMAAMREVELQRRQRNITLGSRMEVRAFAGIARVAGAPIQ